MIRPCNFCCFFHGGKKLKKEKWTEKRIRFYFSPLSLSFLLLNILLPPSVPPSLLLLLLSLLLLFLDDLFYLEIFAVGMYFYAGIQKLNKNFIFGGFQHFFGVPLKKYVPQIFFFVEKMA